MKERRPRKRQPLTLPCMDCRVDTVEIGEYFMINNNELWAQAMGDAEASCASAALRGASTARSPPLTSSMRRSITRAIRQSRHACAIA